MLSRLWVRFVFRIRLTSEREVTVSQIKFLMLERFRVESLIHSYSGTYSEEKPINKAQLSKNNAYAKK